MKRLFMRSKMIIPVAVFVKDLLTDRIIAKELSILNTLVLFQTSHRILFELLIIHNLQA